MENGEKPRRRPLHRYAGYNWHPHGDLYARLSAFAEANGVLRSEALNTLVADALDTRRAGDGLPMDRVDELNEHVRAVLAAVHRLEAEAHSQSRRLDLLGSVVLTVVHALAFASALDPESQEIGESREAAEERVLASVFEASQNAWQILRPAGREEVAATVTELREHARQQGTALAAILMILDAQSWIPKRLREQLQKQKWL